MDIMDKLNKEQMEAVTTVDGPILIIAGAGSGKTRTLTHRVAYLIKKEKVRPMNILAVTFTNKAAGEMKERITKLLKNPGEKIRSYELPLVGTFHSICARILRKEIDKLGYKKSFNILDDQDQVALMKRIFKQLEIDPKQFSPRSFLEMIRTAKDDLKDEKRFKEESNGFYEEMGAKIYAVYQEELRKNNALDFDDLIILTVKLFQKFPEVLEKYQNNFKYILVDEYQDTNHGQYLLINLLAKKHRNLCVVGDDWQSIYGWRGADIKNILSFEKDYPEAKVVHLEQNYRSTQVILDAAHGVISKNILRKDKKLWTEKKEGHLITSFEADDEKKEAEFVVSEIRNLMRNKKNNYNYNSFVVLYRTNAQSRILEEMLLKNSIPYRIIGGIKFYQRKEVKDMIAYLKLINNFNDSISLERIINEPKRGVGGKTLSKWRMFAGEKGLDLIAAGLKVEEKQGEGHKIQSAGWRTKADSIVKFCDFIRRMNEVKDRINLTDLIDKVFKESGYEKELLDGTPEGEMRWENVRELGTVAQKYEKMEIEDREALEYFLEEVALATDTDNINQSQEAVHLMTLHSAKGLEFSVVFIVGLEEGILPHSRSMLNAKEMEEERRLMYVGVTRAKERVYLLFTTERNIFGSTQVNPPSRFLDDIPEHLIEKTDRQNDLYFRNNLQDGKREKSEKQFRDGDKISHPEFGDGIVLSLDGEIATIVFKKVGIKRLSVEFAKLKKKK
jgi:DNA helicase II / ATP-dependent DNA helicase PcrA